MAVRFLQNDTAKAAEIVAYRAMATELLDRGHYIGCNRYYLEYPPGPDCSWVCLRLQSAIRNAPKVYADG